VELPVGGREVAAESLGERDEAGIREGVARFAAKSRRATQQLILGSDDGGRERSELIERGREAPPDRATS
jgi:hypothetical protein